MCITAIYFTWVCPAGYCLWTGKWSGRNLEQQELCTGATSLRGPVEGQHTADAFSCMTKKEKKKLYWGTFCSVGVDCTWGWQSLNSHNNVISSKFMTFIVKMKLNWNYFLKLFLPTVTEKGRYLNERFLPWVNWECWEKRRTTILDGCEEGSTLFDSHLIDLFLAWWGHGTVVAVAVAGFAISTGTAGVLQLLLLVTSLVLVFVVQYRLKIHHRPGMPGLWTD